MNPSQLNGPTQQEIAGKLVDGGKVQAGGTPPLPPPGSAGAGDTDAPPSDDSKPGTDEQPTANGYRDHRFYLDGDQFIEWVKGSITNELNNRSRARSKYLIAVSFTVLGLLLSIMSLVGVKAYLNVDSEIDRKVETKVKAGLKATQEQIDLSLEDIQEKLFDAEKEVFEAKQNLRRSEEQQAMMSIMFQLMILENDAKREPENRIVQADHAEEIRDQLSKLIGRGEGTLNHKLFPTNLAYLVRGLVEHDRDDEVASLERMLRNYIIRQIENDDSEYKYAGRIFARHLTGQIVSRPEFISQKSYQEDYNLFLRYVRGLRRMEARPRLLVDEMVLTHRANKDNPDVWNTLPAGFEPYIQTYAAMNAEQQKAFHGELSYFLEISSLDYSQRRNYSMTNQIISDLVRDITRPSLINELIRVSEPPLIPLWQKLLPPRQPAVKTSELNTTGTP